MFLYDQVPPQDVHFAQQDDLSAFGKLIFAMACCNAQAHAPAQFQRSLDYMTRHYGPDVKAAALFLISKNSPHKVRTAILLPKS